MDYICIQIWVWSWIVPGYEAYADLEFRLEISASRMHACMMHEVLLTVMIVG